MTEAERLERRVRLAEYIGWDLRPWEGDIYGRFVLLSPDSTKWIGYHAILTSNLPNFDTDPAAREELLEWGRAENGIGWLGRIQEDIYKCLFYYPEFTYAEALLSAIDAALQARGQG